MERVFISLFLIVFLIPFSCPATSSFEIDAQLSGKQGLDQLPALVKLADRNTHLSGEKYRKIAEEIVALAGPANMIPEHTFGLRTLAMAHHILNQNEQALNVLIQSRRISQEAEYLIGVVEADIEIANMMKFCFANSPKALAYYQKAAGMSQQIAYAQGYVRAHNNAAEVYMDLERYPQAVDHYLKALRQAEGDAAIPLEKRIVLYVNLAEASLLLQNQTLAIGYNQQALDALTSLNGEPPLFLRESILIQHHMINRQYTHALKLIQEKLSKMARLKPMYSNVAFNRQHAAAFHELGSLKEKMGQYREAFDIYQKVIDHARAGSHRQLEAQARFNRARILTALGNHDSAWSEYALTAEFCRKRGILRWQQQSWLELADLAKKQEDYQAVMRFRDAADEVGTQIDQPRLSAEVTALLVRYESESSDRAVAQFRKQDSWRLTTLLGLSVVTVFCLILIVPRNRRRIRSLVHHYELRQLEQTTELNSLYQKLRNTGLETMSSGELEAKITHLTDTKYHHSSLSSVDAEFYQKALVETIVREKLYLNNQLSLDLLADRVGINRSYLSQIINCHLGKNFNGFINDLRIEEAKRLLERESSSRTTIIDICHQAGFNSKATFNLCFRKATGHTPSQYREKMTHLS